ncbi:zona pellucida sperm-binding protein 1-like [Poecilia reticulata]|uniref:zona pellucida sperm-binding protein 1-like n=1 Tax=Poecilia reticulata TaxID=8081 RepID=UPI0007EAE3E2|nr:PREDICTED: zona pellucida sperm-binding protein 1-like [Poecilia reticulata]
MRTLSNLRTLCNLRTLSNPRTLSNLRILTLSNLKTLSNLSNIRILIFSNLRTLTLSNLRTLTLSNLRTLTLSNLRTLTLSNLRTLTLSNLRTLTLSNLRTLTLSNPRTLSNLRTLALSNPRTLSNLRSLILSNLITLSNLKTLTLSNLRTLTFSNLRTLSNLRTPCNNPQQPQNPQQRQLQNPLQLPYDASQPQYPSYPKPQMPTKNQYPQPQTPVKPQYPEIPQDSVIPSTKGCDVPPASRVPCGAPDITATECEARDCCFQQSLAFQGQSCYFGKGVTVQCTKDGQFIVVVAKDVTLPHIDLETISLWGAGPGCTHVDSNSIFAIYFFPVTACGTVVMEEPGVIIYENSMTSSYEVGVGPLGAITRDSSYELLFQCRYIGTSVETLVVEVLLWDNPPLPIAVGLGPIRVGLKLGNGQCITKGCNDVNAAYTSYYQDSDYPVGKVLRDPVYVEVQLLNKTDPTLVLTLGRCWATTGPNPHSLPQWDILING